MWERISRGDSLYFYRIRYRDFCNIDYVDKNIINIARKNQNFYILFDSSLEAYAYQNFVYLEQFIKNNRLENKVIFLSAHLNVEEEYELWCTHNNKNHNLKVVHYNGWMASTRRYITDTKLKFTDNKTDWFCCLNHRPHYHRIATLVYLDHCGLIERGIVTGHDRNYEDLSNNDPTNNFDEYLSYATEKIDPKYVPIIENQKSLTYRKLPLQYDITDLSDACQPYKMTNTIFDNSLINLVTETFYFNHWNYKTEHFITEKTIKAIMSKQIFIIVGPRGILARLHEMGIRTFSDYFDESYDDEPDSTRLFKAVDSLNYVMTHYSIEELNRLTHSIRLKNEKTYSKINFNINLYKKIRS
jgi:hypothetical protein